MNYVTPIARSIPFDNSTNGFPAAATNVQKAIETTLNFNPQINPIALFDDFDDRMVWSPSTVGTGASSSVGGGNTTYASGKHIGVARMLYGTVLATSAALAWSGTLSTSIVLGNGAAEYRSLIYIPTLASATEDYIIRVGLGTSTTADHANGVYFEYQRSQSVNWRLKTANQSTRTVTTSSIAVAAGQWIKLGWICNAAGDNVDFYVDDVLAGSNTTNIPTTTGQGCGGNFQISASALVNGARDLVADYFYFYKEFTARD